MCTMAGHLNLPPSSHGELGQGSCGPQTLSCLWHKSGWQPASPTPFHLGPTVVLLLLQDDSKLEAFLAPASQDKKQAETIYTTKLQ